MIAFSQAVAEELVLTHSPLARGIAKTLAYAEEYGGIPLTPSKAFKRSFVHWAAAEFAWPGLMEEDLFALNKVLNEIDFPPVGDIHELLIAVKAGRHYKAKFVLTRSGREFLEQHGRIFAQLVPYYLFRFDHQAWQPRGAALTIDWTTYLNVLNVETEDSATGNALRRTLFGEPDPGSGYDAIMASLYVGVLRPLCWSGLLCEDRRDVWDFAERLFTKTPLWRSGLTLDTDNLVRPATRH